MNNMVEKWTPERRRQLTRTALMDAAAEVFATCGFHGASLEEIADTAGFTRGAIYKNFDSKEDLFLAVLDRRIEQQLKGFSMELEREGGLAAMDASRMAATWRDVLGGDREWLMLDLEFQLYAMRNPEVRRRLVAHERQYHKMVARFISEQALALGSTLRIPSDTLASIIVPASRGIEHYVHLDPDARDVYEAFLVLLMTAVSGQEAGPAP